MDQDLTGTEENTVIPQTAPLTTSDASNMPVQPRPKPRPRQKLESSKEVMESYGPQRNKRRRVGDENENIAEEMGLRRSNRLRG
jgi:hypothetical protein